MDFPGSLNAAVARLVNKERHLRDGAASLTAAYKAGKDSSHVHLGAYLAMRVPATYAANKDSFGAGVMMAGATLGGGKK